MTKRFPIILLLIALSTTPTMAASEWLPDDGKAALTQQIAARLAGTHLRSDGNEEQLAAMSDEAITGIMSTIDAWGAVEMIEKVPELEELGLPTSENKYLHAIARYGACNFHLEALYSNRALDETAPSMRVEAAIASAVIPLATANLRHHFQSEGGTDEELREFLTSEEMGAASVRIRGDRELISYSWKECAPTLGALTGVASASESESESGAE